MGRSGCNHVFDETARKLIEVVSHPMLSDRDVAELITEPLVALIRELQMDDWDTEGESLEEFKDNEHVVEAFRRNGIIIRCEASQGTTASEMTWCQRERGPAGHQDWMHEDEQGTTWPCKPDGS